MNFKQFINACGGYEAFEMLTTEKLRDRDLENANIVRGIRWLALLQGISPCKWLDHCYDLYRDYPGLIRDQNGFEIMLDLAPLDSAPYEWWRDFCCRPCRPDTPVRVRAEARDRVIVLGTILRATSVAEAYLWGMQPPANDNRPPETK